ncbi:MAG: beta-lactamase family protein [Planctomycetes bacterium]|nr:beta-lactamase family protein [Planctomycetota bacterium]
MTFALATLLATLAAGGDDPLRDEVERRAWEACEQHHVPGVSLALVRDGRLAWTLGCGWADVAAEREVTAQTVFNIGSISKTVAAWGLMKLVDEEKLALDSPVVTKRWTVPPSEFAPTGVTLRRLLSHTAGLTLHGYPGFWPPKELPSLEASLSGDTNGAGDVRLEAEPGTRWKYSGGGFTWAQLLLEETSGQGFAAYMRTEVLEPLGMQNSAYGWPAEILAASATPYDQDGEPLPRGGPLFPELAAAGLQTTAADMGRFAVASLALFHAEEKARVLRPETIALMQSPAPASPEYGLGYALEHRGALVVTGHGGANEGWMARLSLVTESGDGIVILTNGSNGTAVIQALEKVWLEHVAAARKDAGQAR